MVIHVKRALLLRNLCIGQEDVESGKQIDQTPPCSPIPTTYLSSGYTLVQELHPAWNDVFIRISTLKIQFWPDQTILDPWHLKTVFQTHQRLSGASWFWVNYKDVGAGLPRVTLNSLGMVLTLEILESSCSFKKYRCLGPSPQILI